jgi:hypothetical protein
LAAMDRTVDRSAAESCTIAVRWSWKGEVLSFRGATDISADRRCTQYWRSHLSFDERSMTKLGDVTRFNGRLYVDAGDAVKPPGLVRAPGVDAKLTTDTGLPIVSGA